MNKIGHLKGLAEGASEDSGYRAEARTFVTKLKDFLGKIKGLSNSDLADYGVEPVSQKPWLGGYTFKASRVDRRYSDLIILMLPFNHPRMQGEGHVVRAALGTSGSFKVMFLGNLLKDFSLEHCDTRLRPEDVVHEFVHYLDMGRNRSNRVNTVRYADSGDFDSYFNDPVEFNAYFQEMAFGLEGLMGTESKLRDYPEKFAYYSTWEGFQDMAKTLSVYDKLSGKYKKKFMKRLYGLWKELVQA